MPPDKRKRKQGAPVAPPLPSARVEEDIEVSDEDVEFVRKHKKYVGFLSKLDTKSLNRQVLGLKPDQDGDDLETKYEKSAMRQAHVAEDVSVDPVDVLPFKSFSGELYYRSTDNGPPVQAASLSLEERRAFVRKKAAAATEAVTDGLVEKEEKKTKAERRKDAKQLKRKLKQESEQEKKPRTEEPEQQEEQDPEQEDPERVFKLKVRMAEIGVDVLSDPNGYIMTLKELQDMCLDRDEDVSQLAVLSSMAIFKDLIPGYRIRPPTGKEREGLVSKEVRSLWDYETALLKFYQAYVQLLLKIVKKKNSRWTALRCLCGLLDAVPHFNFRESILSAVVPRMGSDDDDCRNMCCEAIRGLFKSPGKHGDEATVEAVQFIADFVRLRNCQLRPEVIQVFLALSFDDDLLRDGNAGNPSQSAEERKQALAKLSKRGKKAKKRELAAKLRKEVVEDFKESSVHPAVEKQRKSQMLVLSSLFETYFRILKTSLEPERAAKSKETVRMSGNEKPLGPRPLLRSCLDGLAKFSHLISVDFMADLLRVLQALGKGVTSSSGSEESVVSVSVWERLQCCTVAFKIVRLNMDALNIDLREFYTLFYNLLLEVSISDGEHSREPLAQALQIMLWDSSHTDMRRVAAFVKRLATVALHLRSGEAVAVLSTAQQLLMRYKKCRIIVENSPGSGTASSRAMIPEGDEDPDLSDALSTVLWELTLLSQHYNPEIAKFAATIGSMNKSTYVVAPTVTPTAAVKEFSSFLPSVAAPVKPQQKNQTKRRKQQPPPLSPFVEALEERLDQSKGTSLTKKDLKHTKELFATHFKVLKAFRTEES